ncbi:spermidine/putrescine ABC transporter substrate-binding protein [Halomonas sp. PR-M31]|uniref:polyamine ABC transporter substrate-binding protein n=1 Tax=Halomonas sp. PR-M31 TaxID=1471202 RepID=UPI001C10496E|nr:spermidine/putrescine ABC transporter substrate-binding protein [Halomonas sp. PR-M31]
MNKASWVALSLLIAGSPVQANSTELLFFNWPDYMDPAILTEFEQRTGIRVKPSYFDSDSARNELLLETKGKGFDVVLISGASIRVMAKRGWLEPLDATDVPNLKHIAPSWRTAYEEANTYGVPYSWGSVGIIYRKDLVPFTVTSWMDLMRPIEALKGKITMIGDSSELIGAALKALGYSLNSTDVQELNEAEALLQAQAPAVKTYRYLSIGDDSALVSGEVAMSMMYSGDTRMLQQYNDNIVFALPKEGGNVWADYLGVLNASTEKAAAKRFINFLNEPEIAARNAQYIYYATPNRAAEELLSTEFKQDPIIYPSAEALENSETYHRLPARTQKRRSAIFSRIVY